MMVQAVRPARPLIRPRSAATFSRKERRANHERSAPSIPRPRNRAYPLPTSKHWGGRAASDLRGFGGWSSGRARRRGGDSATTPIPEVVDPGTQKRRWTQADENDRRMETSASGIWLRGQTRPSEASRATRREQRRGVTLPDNDRAGRCASSKRYTTLLTPGVARRPAILPVPPARRVGALRHVRGGPDVATSEEPDES
jgi:hypothetical protein